MSGGSAALLLRERGQGEISPLVHVSERCCVHTWRSHSSLCCERVWEAAGEKHTPPSRRSRPHAWAPFTCRSSRRIYRVEDLTREADGLRRDQSA